jgi:hypothetical protein
MSGRDTGFAQGFSSPRLKSGASMPTNTSGGEPFQRLISERRNLSRRGICASGSINPKTANALASSQHSQPAATISGPATPSNVASGWRARIALINPAPSRSPEVSPATSPIFIVPKPSESVHVRTIAVIQEIEQVRTAFWNVR